MFNYTFFLGLILSPTLKSELNLLDSALQSLFLNPQDTNSLQLVTHEGEKYIGKHFHPPLDLASLEGLQINIISMLKSLFPHYSNHVEDFHVLTLSPAPELPIISNPT
jgi:hypothetical protein